MDPFADVPMLLPSGVTPASGGGPSHGASRRTSCPISRSDRKRPSAWVCTPPGTVKLYGQTRPMRTCKR